MKSRCLAMFKSFMFILCLSCLFARADTVVISGDRWCPFNCEPNTAEPGYMVEIAQRALSKAGHTVEYKVMPWERAVQDGREGKIDGIIGAYIDDAPDFIFPKNELGMNSDGVFVLKTNPWLFKGMSSISSITIGVIKGYAYGNEELNDYIKKGGKGIQLTFGDNALELNINKLLAGGRIDAVIESPSVFWNKVNKMNLKDKFKSAGNISNPKNVYIAFSPVKPKSKEYAQILSDGIDAMRKSGELKTILNKYGLEDWK